MAGPIGSAAGSGGSGSSSARWSTALARLQAQLLTRRGQQLLSVAGVLILLLLLKHYEWRFADKFIAKGQVCSHLNWFERQTAVRLWDAVVLDDEVDLLEMRLNELGDVVDGFVVVEAAFGPHGQSQALQLPALLAEGGRLAAFKPLIHHVAVGSPEELLRLQPRSGTSARVTPGWRQTALRHRLAETVRRLAADDDLVLVSNLDELPSATVLHTLKTCASYHTPVELHLNAFLYDFACPVPNQQWRRAKVVQARQLSPVCHPPLLYGSACIDSLRRSQHLGLGLLHLPSTSVRDAGWHMTHFRSTPDILNHLRARAGTGAGAGAGAAAATGGDKDAAELRRINCAIAECRDITSGDYGERHRTAAHGPAWAWQAAKAGRQPYKDYFSRPLQKC